MSNQQFTHSLKHKPISELLKELDKQLKAGAQAAPPPGAPPALLPGVALQVTQPPNTYLPNIKLPTNTLVFSIKSSPYSDSKLCAIVTFQNFKFYVQLYNFENNKIVAKLEHPKKITCISFDHTGNFLATGCEDGKVRIFNLVKCQQGNIRQIFSTDNCENTINIEENNQINTFPIKSLSYNSTGTHLAIGSLQKAYIFVLNDKKKWVVNISYIIEQGKIITCISFISDNILAIGLNHGEITLLSYKDNTVKVESTFKTNKNLPILFIKSINEKKLICTDQYNIYIFNTESKTTEKTIPGNFLALSPENDYIYYKNNDQYMFYYINAQEGKQCFLSNIKADYADFVNYQIIAYTDSNKQFIIANPIMTSKECNNNSVQKQQGPKSTLLGTTVTEGLAEKMVEIVNTQSSVGNTQLFVGNTQPSSELKQDLKISSQGFPFNNNQSKRVQTSPENQGTLSQGSQANPGNQGSQANPGNQGSQANPGNQGSQATGPVPGYPPGYPLSQMPRPPEISSNILNMNPGSSQKDIEKLNMLLESLKTGELEKFKVLLTEKQKKTPDILKNIFDNLTTNINKIDNPNAQKGGAPDAVTQASNDRAKTKKYTKTIDQLSSLLQENFNLNKRFFLEDNKQLIREFLKIKERIEAQNSSGISSTGEMNKLITLIEKTGNPALLQTVKGTKDTIINNLKNQLIQVQDQNQRNAILNQIAAYDFASRSSDQILQKLTEVNNAFDAKIKEISDLNYYFKETLKTNLNSNIRTSGISDPEYIKKIETAIKEFKEDADQKDQKLKSLYYLNYSIMDLTMDSQFYVLYVIKGLRILFAYVSLFLATRIFTPMYEAAVYDKQQNPPALQWYTMIYLALDAAFNVFLFVLLYLIRALFSTTGDFVIDTYLFKKYITDYLISTFLLMAISNLIAVVITKKKYFRYQYEGSRTIRAFEQIMFFTAIILYVFPFFWVL
jgi:hypothetical protein